MNMKLVFILRVIYPVAMATAKIAICIAYNRVFQDRQSRMLVYGMIGYICVTTTASILIVVFQCIPVNPAGKILEPSKCMSDVIQFIILLVGNISSDIFMLVFVVPRISKLAKRSFPNKTL